MYLVAREAAKAGATVEQVVARVGCSKEEKRAVVGRGRQGSSSRSGDLKPRGSCWNCRKGEERMTDCTTKRKLGLQGEKQQVNVQPGGATSRAWNPTRSEIPR